MKRKNIFFMAACMLAVSEMLMSMDFLSDFAWYAGLGTTSNISGENLSKKAMINNMEMMIMSAAQQVAQQHRQVEGKINLVSSLPFDGHEVFGLISRKYLTFEEHYRGGQFMFSVDKGTLKRLQEKPYLDVRDEYMKVQKCLKQLKTKHSSSTSS